MKMTKTKDKKKKKLETQESDYPDKINPFGSGEKLSKNRNKKKDKETNPFLMKPTKSTKKREKAEKKELKKEQKREKKEVKKNAKGKKAESKNTEIPKIDLGTETDNVPESNPTCGISTKDTNNVITPRQIGTIGSYDPPMRDSKKEPLFSRDAQVSRTLDGRSPTRHEQPSPILPNKRILELKTSRERGTSQNASLPDLTHKPHYQYRPTKSNSNQNMKEIGTTGTRDTTPLPPPKQRPVSLEVQSSLNPNKWSPVIENRSPSPLIPRPHTEDSDVKMYRTASISKKGKDKKKKKRLKKLLKKKKKKGGKSNDVIEEQGATEQVVMRRPKVHDIETLRREAEEVKEIARTSIINMVEQRNSALDRLTANTAQLEEFAHGFATCAQEARLKQQARVTCCGIGSKWKVCWYICACQGKIKRRKRKQQKNGKAIPEAEELLEDDDYYRPANTESSRVKQENEIDAQVETNPFLSKSNSPTVSYSQDGNKEQSQQQSNTLKSKLLKLPKTLRGSLPSLVDDYPPPGRSLRSMANIDPRERKSSSVSALHEIVKKRGKKERLKRDILEEEARDELPPMSRPLSYLSNIDPRQRKSSSVSALNEIKKSRAEKRREEKEKKEKLQQREKREKDIDKFASQYTDEATKKKVAELLKLDLS